MVHRVYICSNLKSPLVVQECDHVEGYNSNNLGISSSSSFVLKQQVKIQEGEHCWLLRPQTSTTTVKPRTVCFQGG